MMNAFITGSRAYGVPGTHSDIDLVILISEQEARHLALLADTTGGAKYEQDVDLQFRFGKLNVIATWQPEVFEAWRKGTGALKCLAPVSRDAAKALLQPLVTAARATLPQ